MAIVFLDNASGTSVGTTITTGTYLSGTTPCTVVLVAIQSASITVSTVTQSGGPTFTRKTSKVQGAGATAMTIELWAGPAVGTDGTAAVVVTLSSSTTDACAVGLKYTGVLALGTTATGGTTSTNPTVSLVTQDTNNYVVGGFAINDSAVPTGLTGTFRGADQTANSAVGGADNTAASASSVTVAVTHNSQVWASAALELRTSAAAGGGTTIECSAWLPQRRLSWINPTY